MVIVQPRDPRVLAEPRVLAAREFTRRRDRQLAGLRLADVSIEKAQYLSVSQRAGRRKALAKARRAI